VLPLSIFLPHLSFSRSPSRDILRSGFLQHVSDLLLKISDITSNKEFQTRVLNSLDLNHYQAMMTHHAFGSVELLTILDILMSLIGEFQSEVRKREYLEWYQAVTVSYRQSEEGEKEELRMNSLILFLPLYFEMMMTRIEELQVEVKNPKLFVSFLPLRFVPLRPHLTSITDIQFLSLHARTLCLHDSL
jgi:hypothetical protein